MGSYFSWLEYLPCKQEVVGSSPTGSTSVKHNIFERKYNIMSNELKVMQLTARKNLLLSRDPVANANLVRKIERQIRKYSTKE